MRKIIFLTAFIVMLISAIPSMAATSEYDFRGYASSFLLTDSGISFNYTGDCIAEMTSTNTFVSDPVFDSTITWRSPDLDVHGFSTLTGISNTSCLSYGVSALKPVSRDSTSLIYESSWDVTHSATSGFVNTRTRYVCDVPTEIINFIITSDDDSRNECQWLVAEANSDSYASFLTTLETNYNRCGDLNSWASVDSCMDVTTGLSSDPRTVQYIYPINSSSIGSVNYSFTDASIRITVTAGTPTIDYFVDIINAETETTANVHTTNDRVVTSGVIHNLPNLTGTLSLTPNTQYLWVLTFLANVPFGQQSKLDALNIPTMELEIFTFSPNYICGEFGECINGTQSQICQDSFGVAPDETRTTTCFDVPFFINVLGFEEAIDFAPDDIYVCQRQWDLFACPQILRTIPASFPVNWTVSGTKDFDGVFRDNYIEITSRGGATEGSRALRMWYVPPRVEEPIPDPNNISLTVCGNLTTGKRPFSTTGFNESLFVSTNITFPAPNIQLRYDVKRCAEPAVQRDNSNDTWSFCDITGAVRKRCYGRDCETAPLGKYSITMFDADTLIVVFLPIEEEASLSWETKIINLADANLQVDHNYTLVLLAHPGNLFEADSDCVYFDNVQATLTETEQPCDTQCLNFDRVVSRLQGDVCFSTLVVNAPECAPDSATATAFENFDDICIGLTLFTFNNQTGFWEEFENNDLCISQANETAEQIEGTQPLPDTASYISFFDFLFSPIFIYIIFSLIISGILSAGIAKVTNNGDGVFQVFGVTMMIFVLLGSLPGIAVIPIWISITVIAVISLLIAQKLRGFGFPGGGG